MPELSARSSVLEEALRAHLDNSQPLLLTVAQPVGGPLFDVDLPVVVDGHGGRRPAGLGAETDADERRLGAFREVLEAGARYLTGAARAQLEQRRLAAVQARGLAEFARHRPSSMLDRPDDEVGAAAAASRAARPTALTEVSEWAVDEVMAELGLSSQAAAVLLTQSVTLVEQLPATLRSLEQGVISWAHATMLVEVLEPLSHPDKRAEVEAKLLARAANKTVPQLRAAARRAVLRADASAATRRLATAIRQRQVRVHTGKDGVGSLTADGLPVPVVLACRTALEEFAKACAIPDDPRTMDQRIVDCLVDLVLRPDASRPSITVNLTVVAGVNTLAGGDEPGEIDGQTVPAELVRELAHVLGLLPRTGATEVDVAAETMFEAEAGAVRPAVDSAQAARTTAADEAAGARSMKSRARALTELLNLRSIAGTALTHLPTIAVVDEISGQLLALTNAAGLRSGQSLGPPVESAGYSPSVSLQAFVRARDRRCRFPGCRAAAIRCDLDHNQPWPLGPTSADNLCCLCRHHHRLSHQAPGWTMRRLPDGGVEWTLPSGRRIATHPQPYGTDDLPPPQPPLPPPARLTLRDRILGRPATSEERASDPAPY